VIAALLLAAAAACPPLTPAGLAAEAHARGGEVTLVFFASWCASCKEHLTAKHDWRTLLIGSFDKPERLTEVVTALKPDAPCFTDAGIAAALGVSALPVVVPYRTSGASSGARPRDGRS
jgi:hypothetical protein